MPLSDPAIKKAKPIDKSPTSLPTKKGCSRGLVARDVSASIDLNLILTNRETTHHAALIDPIAVGGLMRAIASLLHLRR